MATDSGLKSKDVNEVIVNHILADQDVKVVLDAYLVQVGIQDRLHIIEILHSWFQKGLRPKLETLVKRLQKALKAMKK